MSAFLDRAFAGEVIVAIGQIDRDARRELDRVGAARRIALQRSRGGRVR